eukprot:GEMP01048466.1.p1 GENE.GEMP01048466.1~~GEMP01048466.1.p1  ORF type:complete len:387 (+),score=116.59 GEMP01048466.1:3-1163(+)
MFGAPAASSGGGSMFGAPTAASGGGSMFGAPAATSGGGGSMFGAPAASSGGGGSMFGAPAASSGGGSIFGAPTAAAGGGSMFGAPAASSDGGGSMFGAPAASSGGGSIFGATSGPLLFGAAPTSGGATSSGTSFFGASGSSSGGAATGSLFGASTGATTGTSLFGASSGGKAGTSLFGAGSSGGASSGGGLFGATGGGATALENTQIQQAKLQVLENRKVDDLLRNIEDRIVKQTSYFDSFASQIVQVDAEILASVTKIKELENEYRQLNDKRQVVDNTINEIGNQQASLMQLLVGIQTSLNAKSSQVTDAPKSHEKTLRLMQYMEDLESMVDNLTSEIQKVHVNSYSSTVAQVAQILNSQTTCLDTMQQETEQVAERIKQVEKMF